MTTCAASSSTWVVYLIRCGDGSYYAGMTNAMERRLAAHREGRGARYTRGRGPLALAYVEACASRSAALRREAELKRLRHAARHALALSGEDTPSAAPGG